MRNCISRFLLIFLSWWTVFSTAAFPPPNPGLRSRGILSSDLYYVKQATDAISILTLDGTNRVDFKTPGRYIFQPKLSWRSEQHLYYLTNTNWENNLVNHGLVLGPYSLICADLVSGITQVIANLNTGPSIYYLVVETEGIDFVSRFDDLSLWSSGIEYPIKEGTAGRLWDLQFSAETGKLRWLTCTDPGISHASDVIEPIRELRFNEYDLAARRTKTTLIDLHRFHREMIHPSFYCQDGPVWMLFVNTQGLRWLWYDTGNTIKDWFHLSQPIRIAPPHDTWLIAYDTRTGQFRKAHTFKNRSHLYGKDPWIVEGTSLVEDQAFLYNWKTAGRVLLPNEKLYGIEKTQNDNPIVLTDRHIYVYDKDSMVIKERYETPPRRDGFNY
jgi:hypothetical protein